MIAPVVYRILQSSYPTPAFPPVTIKTLPFCEGKFTSVKLGVGGNHCERALQSLAMDIIQGKNTANNSFLRSQKRLIYIC